MKPEIRRIFLALTIPLFILFVLYAIKILEVGMEWDFTKLGVYPMAKKGVFGIFAHPLVHADFAHLFANTIPLLFLSWCLFYFFRDLGAFIFFSIWIICGVLTFIIGKQGWHIGASGLIYGLAFFLFFSGLLRKHAPLIAISLLVTFLYGGLVWNMVPYFAKENTSWEGHLSGAVAGTIAAVVFSNKGPQKPEAFAEEEESEEEEEEATLPQPEEEAENTPKD